MGKIDVASLLARVDLVALIAATLPLKKRGREYVGRCPFHDEGTPSFTVNGDKGFFHCFGCGAHGNAIEWLIRASGCDFIEACRRLGADRHEEISFPLPAPAKRERLSVWVPLLPVPADATPLFTDGDRRTQEVWNPKEQKFCRYNTVRADAYCAADGRLLGYVIRIEFTDSSTGKRVKITPTVTWCVGPEGEQRWCLRPFPVPRPLYGLDALAQKPTAPLLLVEGEKCRAAGADALPMYAVVSWPGGGKGLQYADFSPLCGRDLVLWPDADEPGRQAMLGYRDYHGLMHDGLAQIGWRAGAKSIRFVDVSGQPKGWDIADALDPAQDGWTPPQLAAWARSRVAEIEVEFQPGVRAA